MTKTEGLECLKKMIDFIGKQYDDVEIKLSLTIETFADNGVQPWDETYATDDTFARWTLYHDPAHTDREYSLSMSGTEELTREYYYDADKVIKGIESAGAK